MPARRKPAGEQIAEMATLVVACVAVRRAVLDPAPLAVDQEVDLRDLRWPDIRISTPA
jgi:hypothetical protein